jgi:hypothetical protein
VCFNQFGNRARDPMSRRGLILNDFLIGYLQVTYSNSELANENNNAFGSAPKLI